MLRLYDNTESGNCYKVRLMLAHLGRDYEKIPIDVFHRSDRPEEFIRKTTIGKVPALELDDGKVLTESNAILWYLAEGTPYLPDDRIDQTMTLRWMFFEQNNHEPSIAVARHMLMSDETDEARRALLHDRQEYGRGVLRIMERHLEIEDWFAAKRYSIADIALYAYTHVAGEGGFDLEPFPAVRAWLGRVAGRPGHVPMRSIRRRTG